MSEFKEEFDYILERGWWFSVIPTADSSPKKPWRCAIYKKSPSGTWNSVESKQFKTIVKGMVWIELYLMNKLEDLEKGDN